MAGKTSAENGKLGGRPKGFAALEAEKTREFIAQRLIESHGPIVAKAVTQAMEGDRYAREWLYDRAFGKSPQAITGPDGGEFIIRITSETAKRYGLTPSPDTSDGSN